MVSLNRVVMHRSTRRMIDRLNPEALDAAEISGKFGKRFTFKSYTQFAYPTYDICAGPFTDPASGAARQFDLILANQVWEHLDRPYTALGHVQQMLRPGGYFWIAVPFSSPFMPPQMTTPVGPPGPEEPADRGRVRRAPDHRQTMGQPCRRRTQSRTRLAPGFRQDHR
ncbi:class I SAM-dependent methyltransferase [Sulfitobacter faviae]|uniref:class I SAM-dependent methyltransferase n=1 Tax=Sulfitobacter faviae TaxID=1775881 RepID=UPI0031BAB673